MGLTAAQQTAVAADISADNTLNSQPPNSDGDTAIALAYNQAAAGTYWVYRSNVPLLDIQNAINWPNFTPADAVPTDTVLNNAIWQARSLKCQGQQLAYTALMQGRTTFDASRLNLRLGLQDATQNLPSGAAGASQSAGWATILPLLSRQASRVEKLLALKSGSGVNNNVMGPTGPDTMGYEGPISYQDIQTVRGR